MMKRILAALLALMLCLSSAAVLAEEAPAAQPEEVTEAIEVVTEEAEEDALQLPAIFLGAYALMKTSMEGTEGVSLQPGTVFASAGEPVTAENGTEWLPVKMEDGTEGFVPAAQVFFTMEQAEDTAVTAEQVDLTDPSGAVLATLKTGDEVTLLASSTERFYARFGEMFGLVAQDAFLTEEEPVEEKAEEPVEEPAEEKAEEPAEEPAEEKAEEPAEEKAEEPAEEPAEEKAEEPAEEPAEKAESKPATGDKVVRGVTLRNYNPQIGSMMKAISYDPERVCVTYEWLVDGEVKSHAIAYIVTVRDLGKKIALRVTGKNGYTGVVTSEETAPVTGTNQLQSIKLQPSRPKCGDKVTVKIDPKYACVNYYWYLDETLVSKNAEFVVPDNAKGCTLTCMVCGKGGFEGRIKVKTLIEPEVESVTLNKTKVYVGTKLTAKVSPSAAKVAWQWYRITENGSEPIKGATSNKYTATKADLGYKLMVEAIGVKGTSGIANAMTKTVKEKTK